MSPVDRMENYIDVNERIAAFSAKYPEGSLQTIDWSVETIGEKQFVVYRAAAYRTPTDKRPGHGIAWEPFPGPTSFTRDSELMNAETSAWGRAIVAVGLPASRKIASRQEVQARQPEQKTLPEASVDEVLNAIRAAKMGTAWVRSQLIAVGHQNVPAGELTRNTIRQLSETQAVEMVKACAKATREKA